MYVLMVLMLTLWSQRAKLIHNSERLRPALISQTRESNTSL